MQSESQDWDKKEKRVSTTNLGDVAAAVGKGLFAGVAGTAAMTVSSTLEAKLSGRGASLTPAQTAEKVLGVKPVDDEAEARFSNLVHWGYGTGWGSVRGLLAATRISPLPGPPRRISRWSGAPSKSSSRRWASRRQSLSRA
jgi:hypothetical protein